MFVLEEGSVDFSSVKGNLLSILQSINEPKIAAEGRPAEPTQAFVFTAQAKKRLQTWTVLYLAQSHEAVVYSWEEGAYDPSRKGEVEEAALDFVEGMGFMMDNLNFAKLAADQQKSLLTEIPVFRKTKKPAKKEEEAEEPIASEILEGVPEERIEDLDALLATHPVRKEQPPATDLLELDALEMERKPALAAASKAPSPTKIEESGAAMDAMAAEFERSEGGLNNDELDSIFGTLDSGAMKAPDKVEVKREQGQDRERWKAWIRLMSSF